MIELRAAGRLPRTTSALEAPPDAEPNARVIYAQVPNEIGETGRAPCKIWLENAGRLAWSELPGSPNHAWLSVRRARDEVQRVELRCHVQPGARVHLVFELMYAPRERETLRFELQRTGGSSLELARASVEPRDPQPWWRRWLGSASQERA
jgi:hypothetical protein